MTHIELVQYLGCIVHLFIERADDPIPEFAYGMLASLQTTSGTVRRLDGTEYVLPLESFSIDRDGTLRARRIRALGGVRA